MITVKPRVEIWENPATPGDRLLLIEKAGRVCYKSESNIADGTADKFVKAIMARGHLSVIEHANIILRPTAYCFSWLLANATDMMLSGRPCYLRFTDDNTSEYELIVSGNARAWHDFLKRILDDEFTDIPADIVRMMFDNRVLFDDLITEHSITERLALGESVELSPRDMLREFPNVREKHQTHTLKFVTDRGVSHELVRHRTMSFSQESTRYCNYSADKFGSAITAVLPDYISEKTLAGEWYGGIQASEHSYFSMLNAGATAQEARGLLPTDLKTEIVVTATDIDWKHFLDLRMSSAAHPNIRKAATRAAELLVGADPEVFADYNN